MTAADLDNALDAAARTQAQWAQTDLKDRCDLLLRAAAILRDRKHDLAALAVTEMGKPVTEALGEVEKCAWVCEHYAQESQAALADEVVVASGSRSWVSYEPLGVVLAIMPWNFPYWQVFRFAAPALAAGNAGMLKHSPNVSGCALAIQQVFEDAGAPAGLFTTLLIAEPDVPDAVQNLIADDRIAAVTLTGSNRAGSHVAAAAGRAVKKSVLELGGSDPFVVLADADLDIVIPNAVAGALPQHRPELPCAKRFIVHTSIAEEFGRRFADAVAALPVGDPADAATKIGPLARADLADSSAPAGRRLRRGRRAGSSTGGTPRSRRILVRPNRSGRRHRSTCR